jgi:hypothetical protein
MPARGFIDDKKQQIPFEDVLLGKGKFSDHPRALVNALARQSPRNYCDVHASFIAGGLVQQEMLKQRHDFWLKVDDVFYQAFGNAFHLLMERKPDGTAQTRKQYVVKHKGGVTVGGVFDELNVEEVGKKHVLWDYKTAAVYKAKMVKKDGIVIAAPEWCRQVNVYLWLLLNAPDSEFRQYVDPATWKLMIYLLARDWRGYEQRKSRGYPAWGEKFEVPVEDPEVVERWIDQVVVQWVAAKDAKDEDLPECSADQLWNGKRCADYCEVAEFCAQKRRQAEFSSNDTAATQAAAGSEPD